MKSLGLLPSSSGSNFIMNVTPRYTTTANPAAHACCHVISVRDIRVSRVTRACRYELAKLQPLGQGEAAAGVAVAVAVLLPAAEC